MKKILFILLFLILICITFKAMHWNGANAIVELSSVVVGILYLVIMLEHAKNIDEAVLLMNKYNIMNDVWSGSFDQHMLIADASGRSVVAEISEGKFRFTYNTQSWLATTNDPSYKQVNSRSEKSLPAIQNYF
ncbi:MAG: linear amide C-N hydrolase [Bacteroidia bacterium]